MTQTPKFARVLLYVVVLGLHGLSGLAWADNQTQIAAALSSGQPALIEFGAKTCSQCQHMKVVLDGIEQRYRGRAQVIQVIVNKEKALTRKFKIMVIPTLVYFDRQGHEAGRAYGYQDEVTVAKKLYDLGAR